MAVDVGAAAERVADHVFATTHAYDELGNRVQTVLPNGRQVDTLRYGAGHWHGVLWQGSSVVDVVRDRLHREKRRKLGTGKQRMDGRRGYDPQSRLVEMTLRMGPVASDVYALRERSFEYDRAGNLTRMRHGWHSRDETLGTFTYTYDPLGQLLSAGQRDLDEVFAFDPAGNLLDPGPERFQSAWDRQVAEWQKPPAAPPPPVTHNLLKRYRDTAYEYDGQGNTIRKVFERDDNPYAKVELELGYDAENRLVRAVRTGRQARHSAQYIYDAFSRRIAKRVTEERWDNNQVCYTDPPARVGHHVALFVWDGDAMVQELRQGDTVTYLYEPDCFVPLARITSAGGFALDEDAARADALEPGAGSAVFHLARIASWHLPSVNGDKEKQAATATAEAAAEELHLAARCQLEVAANDAAPRDRIDLYSCDHLGTPREMFDGQGRVVWSAKYKAWGKVFEEKNQGVEQPLRFQGQYADAETGLHYNRYRYYDPDAARYVQSDPIGLAGGINTYGYGLGNPVSKVDPLGLAEMCYRPIQGYIIPGQHCFARFNGKDNDTSSFTPNGVGPDASPKGAICEKTNGPDDDDCVKREMGKCQSYNFLTNNCCHCVEQALKACGQSIPAKKWPNYPINPGPQRGEPGYKP
ncbi:hypothetical protein CSQ96_19955 [Janthinobacterium sp. BJB412]|nr:hypothetical protein CSQ96_19955 [Janthinobacterium sp. BJB412]